MTQESPILVVLEQYRRALERRDQVALNRLIDAYGRSFARLQDKIDLLVAAIANEQPTRGQLVRMERYQDLMAQVMKELNGMQALTADQIDAAGKLGVTWGARDGAGLISTALTGSPRVAAGFNKLPTKAIETLLGFLSPDGPLYARLDKLAPTVAKSVSDALVEGVALGYNPRKIAAQITNAYGMGLTDSLRMTRTAQIWSYREANRATYLANNDVVEGWIWCAELGPDTCMSCIAMHGTEHPLDEALDDHHNGRCSPVPVVKGFDNPIEQTGEAWYEAQKEATQKQMMGATKWQAWKEKKFKLQDLPGTYQDEVYGQMRSERSLKDLLGNEEE